MSVSVAAIFELSTYRRLLTLLPFEHDDNEVASERIGKPFYETLPEKTFARPETIVKYRVATTFDEQHCKLHNEA